MEAKLHNGSQVTWKCYGDDKVLTPRRAEDKYHYSTPGLSIYMVAQGPYKEWGLI